MTILKIKDYYVKTDKINYYSYCKENDETNISCDGVWFCVRGDYSKQISEELKKAELARIVTLGD